VSANSILLKSGKIILTTEERRVIFPASIGKQVYEKIISNDRFSIRRRVETIILQGKDFIVFFSAIIFLERYFYA